MNQQMKEEKSIKFIDTVSFYFLYVVTDYEDLETE